MKGFCLFTLSLFLFGGLVAEPASAFRFIPFIAEFEPSGSGANRTYTVENTSEDRIAVEVSVHKRGMNLDGTDRLQDADDDFIVYPTQVVLEPHRKQAIRVQFIGDPAPDRELAYRIIAEQLPVELDAEPEPGANVRILVRYVGSIYVRPKQAAYEVVLERAGSETLENGSRGLAITLHNKGTAHAILKNLELSFSSQNGAGPNGVQLSSEFLKGMTGENILAMHKRRFVLPWPAKLPHGPVDVSFVFDKEFQ